jgi:lysophospholipase L1-like esterase
VPLWSWRAGSLVLALGTVVWGQALVGPVPAARTPGPHVDYVALGDSFSAGPFVPAQELAAGTCLRSTHNYPSLLARALPVDTLVDVTCSGADTDDLARSVPNLLPGPPPRPQLDALGPGTDLVTVGIGGNDFGLFGGLLRRCAVVARTGPDGAPCRRAFTVDGVDTELADARRVRPDVAWVVGEVRRRAPRAEVWVVGYPRLLPPQGTCAAVPFAAGDYRWADRVERELNASLQAAARSLGAGFVDVYAASAGHDACAGPDAWVNGSVDRLGRAAAYHPFRAGMEGTAQAVREALLARSELTFPAA